MNRCCENLEQVQKNNGDKIINYISLFSGIGGFEYGIQQSKYAEHFNNIGFSEIDKYAKSIYIKHFPKHPDLGDATRIRTEELPNIDFLVGGFPCQAFSTAGKRRGFDDARGTLFFEIARILKDKRPKHFLLENVQGLLSHNKGKTFQTILGVLTDLGYTVTWQVLNSKDFGVPQNRKRVYIMGYLGRKCGREIFLESGTNKSTNSQVDYLSDNGRGKNGLSPTITASSGELVKVNEPCIKKVGNVHPSGKGMSGEVFDDSGLSPTITTNKGEGVKVKVNQNIKRLGNIYPSGYCTGTIYDLNGVSPTLTCSHSKSVNIQVGTKKGYQEAVPGDRITLTRPGCKTRRGRVSKQSSNTLLTDKNLGTLTSDFRIRRLTPLECERLQGFPDNWTQYGADGEEISNTQRYKCCGNAVTTNVITYLINSIWDNLS